MTTPRLACTAADPLRHVNLRSLVSEDGQELDFESIDLLPKKKNPNKQQKQNKTQT